MTLRLTVDTATWRRHVDTVTAAVPGLIAVVKGNGYGFGRIELARVAAEWTDTIAVGTVHELDYLPAGPDIVVLTPSIDPVEPIERHLELHSRIILTVGSQAHVDAARRLARHLGIAPRVVVKLASAMRRYGRGTELIAIARDAGLDVVAVGVHPPLAGTDADRLGEITELVSDVAPDLEVWVSHLTPETFRELPDRHRYRLRLGTWLWHGDKSALHLTADVLDTRAVATGDRAGYRLVEAPGDGTLVMVGAGSAHGVAPLADGRSPFHHARRRLTLLEPPHMHTSMVFVPSGEPVPEVGERVDVQRPLITTHVDVVEWT